MHEKEGESGAGDGLRKTVRLLVLDSFLTRHKKQYHTPGELLAEFLKGYGYRVCTASSILFEPGRFASILLHACGILCRWNICIVNLYSGRGLVWGEWATRLARLRRAPIILILRCGNLPRELARKPSLLSRILRRAHAVVSPSSYLAETFADVVQDVEVIPNPLDLSKFSGSVRPHAGKNLLWLRAFHWYYNPEMAIRVLGRLKEQYPEIHLYMGGPEKEAGKVEACERLAKELGVEENVTVLGLLSQAEVITMMRKCDILLNTSSVDNAPKALLEAQAMGMCVVTGDAGGIRHVVADARNALVVPDGEVETMSDKVRILLESPDLVHQLSQNSVRDAENFGFEPVLSLWEDLFRRVQ